MNAVRRVDLNADVGESTGDASARIEEALLAATTTVHVACGYHAGDDTTMRRVVAAAVSCGVVVGAHPSYPDRAGFGRRDIERSPVQVATDVRRQLDALATVTREWGTGIRSVKPHGALYHRTAGDEACAAAISDVLAGGSSGGDAAPVALVMPAGAATAGVPPTFGVPVVAEAFCDRRYRSDGTLVPRSEAGSVITDVGEAVEQALSIVLTGTVTPVSGDPLPLLCDTLCVHGDTPGAPALVTGVRRALEAAGVVVAPYVGSAVLRAQVR